VGFTFPKIKKKSYFIHSFIHPFTHHHPGTDKRPAKAATFQWDVSVTPITRIPELMPNSSKEWRLYNILSIHIFKFTVFYKHFSELGAIVLLYITSAFRDKPCRILKVLQRFGKHCSCYLQGECVLVASGSLLLPVSPPGFHWTDACVGPGATLQVCCVTELKTLHWAYWRANHNFSVENTRKVWNLMQGYVTQALKEAIMNTSTEFRVKRGGGGNLLTNWASIKLPRRTLLLGIS
jgi:hypothetical protein